MVLSGKRPDRIFIRPQGAQCPSRRASQIASNTVFAICALAHRRNSHIAIASRKHILSLLRIASEELGEDALKPEWNEEYRALFDRLTLEETETAKRKSAMPGTDSMPGCCNNKAGAHVPDREMPDRDSARVPCVKSIRSQ